MSREKQEEFDSNFIVLIEIAKKDYKSLKDFINAYNQVKLRDKQTLTKKDLLELSVLLGGHNYCGEFFDLNYGVICATIQFSNLGFKLNRGVEIWDDDKCVIVCANYGME